MPLILVLKKLITTDCVDLISPTKFVWKGRSDFVINSGGIKLHPEQIEKAAFSRLFRVPFFVFGKPDQTIGCSLCPLCLRAIYQMILKQSILKF